MPRNFDHLGSALEQLGLRGTLPRPQSGPRAALRPAPRAQADDAGEVETLRLYAPISRLGEMWGFISADDVAAALDEIPDAQQILLHINSPGGEVFEAVAILNQLRQHQASITAVVDGLAASAASFIACGADEAVMGPNTQMMIHDAWGICIGAAADMHGMGDRLDKLSDNVASIYQSKAGGEVGDWRDVMLAETWYDAQEAVDLGLADRVDGEETEDDDPAAKAEFDLSVFQHAGRSAAPAPRAARKTRPAKPPAKAPPKQAACGCGPDVAGMQHKAECVAASARAARHTHHRHSEAAARHGLPL